jgi:hypothetical protein
LTIVTRSTPQLGVRHRNQTDGDSALRIQQPADFRTNDVVLDEKRIMTEL